MKNMWPFFAAMSVALWIVDPICAEETQPVTSDVSVQKKHISGKEDCVVFANGMKWRGTLEEVPALEYSFGIMPFSADEVAAIAFVQGNEKMEAQYMTHDGKHFSAKVGPGKLRFRENHLPAFQEGTEVNPTAVTFVVVQRRDSCPICPLKHLHFLTLRNGDRLTVVLDPRDLITLSDGWEEQTVSPQDIVDFSYDSCVRGCYANGGEQQELSLSFVKDKYLNVQLAGTLEKMKFPWAQVERISSSTAPLSVLAEISDETTTSEEALSLNETTDEATSPDETTPPAEQNLLVEEQTSPPEEAPEATTEEYVHVASQVLTPDESADETTPPSEENLLVEEESSAEEAPEAAEERVYIASHVLTVPVEIAEGEEQKNYVPTADAPSVLILVDGFYIDEHPVTNAEYAKFLKETGHPAPTEWIKGEIASGSEEKPVVHISYKDAQAYAKWSGKRLPTEQEWELAVTQQAGHDLSNVQCETSIGRLPESENQMAEWTSTSFGTAPALPFVITKQTSLDELLKQRNVKVVRRGFSLSSANPVMNRTPMEEHDGNALTGFRLVSDS